MESFSPLFQARNLLGLTETDLYAAETVCRRLEIPDARLLLAAACIGRALREGHTCLTYGYFQATLQSAEEAVEGVAGEILVQCREMDEKGWKRLLKPFKEEADGMPLIADAAGQLYYRRFRRFERQLADMIRERTVRAGARVVPVTEIERYVTGMALDAQQMHAVGACADNYLTVVSGGPGTGKTTLVAAVLQVLAGRMVEDKVSLKIALAAPTGKAAKRLGAAIAAGCAGAPDAVRERIPAEAVTLHRLLKCSADGSVFRRNRDKPLEADVVIVDEASMVDIRMMEALFAALPADAQLILLGDYNQLASVEAGSVLADMCTAGTGGLLRDAVVTLEKTYRFAGGEGIGSLSRAVNDGDAGMVMNILADARTPDTAFYPAGDDSGAALRHELTPLVREWGAFLQADTPERALELLGRFRVLCAVHEGWYGVRNLNEMVEGILLQHKLIRDSEGFYRGRPIIVLRNDYGHNVFNGDIGIVWHTGGVPLVHFEDGRTVSPQVLPEHASAYALSVHKSQGSEFGQVLLVLPDAPRPVLSRQLLYTAVTRARDAFGVFGSEGVVRSTVETPAVRYSGLGELLKS